MLWGQGPLSASVQGVCCPLSGPACASASRKSFLKGQCLRCFAGLFHTPIYSLGSLIWPALTQLYCQVWVSCLVRSLGQREELLHFRRGESPSNQPARPAAFLALQVLPGSGNTIQSVTGGVCFTGGWKQKGVKRTPRTPCAPEELGYPSLVSLGTCRASLHCSSGPSCSARPLCACRLSLLWATAAAGSLSTAEWSEQGEPCQLCRFYALGSLVGTCYCFMSQQ